jgi:hypothetical protein
MSLSFVGDVATLPLVVYLHHDEPYHPVQGDGDGDRSAPAPQQENPPTPEIDTLSDAPENADLCPPK